MSICHINLAKDYRGGERQTELLLRELAERGHEQRLVVRAGNELARRCAGTAGLTIRQVASNPVAAALATRGCSLVHAHEARGVYGAWLASLLFRSPYVITRRVLNPLKPSLLRDRAYRGAAAVIAISQAVAEPVAAAYPGLTIDNVPDAHAALTADPDVTADLKARYAGKYLIGCVAALDPAKGQMTLIEVARVAATKHPDWHILFLGSGADEARLRSASEDLANVEFAGFVDQLGSYYACFDVFAFPTHREAIGSAMLDAMYFGLPIVASNVGGIPEFAVDGVNGRLVEPESPQQMLAALEELVANPEWVARMRAANIESAAALSAAAMADRYEAIYRRCR